MSFRDDREALVQKIAALEAERDQLRAGIVPVVQRLRWTALAFGAVMTAGAIAFFAFEQSERAAEAARCAHRIEELTAQSSALEAERDAARADARQARDAADRAATPVLPAPAPSPTALPNPPPTHVALTGTISAHTGHAPTHGTPSCTVDVTSEAWATDCHATVTCGGVALYPQAGGGWFHCEIEDGRVVRGADTNPTISSGDPRLELELARGRIVVSDTEPDWSVTIRVPQPNPY